MSPRPAEPVDRLSTTDWAVLGVLALAPSHGFALARSFTSEQRLGRILTVRRPLVYRSLARLVDIDFAKPIGIEAGDAGPNRIIHEATPTGVDALQVWLKTPVDHMRQMRIDFMVKLTLHRMAGTSPGSLVRSQMLALEPTIDALSKASPADDVALWRLHNARAIAGFLEDITQ